MKTQYQINTAKVLSESISSLGNARKYLDSKKKRGGLAELMKQVINIGSGYPPKVVSMTNNTANMLYKAVSNTCPACVNKRDMLGYIQLSLRDLKTYNTRLSEWLDDDFVQEEPKSIHDLRPTK